MTPGVNGILVPPGDGGSIAGAVAALAADDVLRKEYGAAARASAVGRSWASIGDELIEHYRQVLGGRTTTPGLPVQPRRPRSTRRVEAAA